MTPVFMELKSFLEEQIAQGVYQPGDLIPSETELMKAWSVSRITVRNAVRQLCSEGLVYTVHGRGTFVAEQKITNYLPSLTSLSADVRKKGMVPSRHVLKLEVIEADKDVATRLHISPGSQVIHFVRITLANKEPIAVAYTYISVPAVVPHQGKFTIETLENSSFYQLLGEIGVHLYGGTQTISASAAGRLEAEALKVNKGYPLIDSERVAFTRERKYVEYTRMLAKPDYIQWKVSLGPVGKDEDGPTRA
jgi:GntR family transcriptional regulator